MLDSYKLHIQKRQKLNLPPLPLDKGQTLEIIKLLENPPKSEEKLLMDIFTNSIPAGVDEASKVKAEFLKDIVLCKKKISFNK